MPPFNFNFHFRRLRSRRGRKDDTEITLTGSIVLILVLVLALLVATGVITPDAFARMMDRTLPWRPALPPLMVPHGLERFCSRHDPFQVTAFSDSRVLSARPTEQNSTRGPA